MSGTFEIAGIYARKTTIFGAGPAVEVEIRLAGGAAGRAMAAAAPCAARVLPETGLTGCGGGPGEMVNYINTVISAALKFSDAYYMEVIESRLKSTLASGCLPPLNESVVTMVLLAVSRARTAQLRAEALPLPALVGWNLKDPEENTK